MASSVSLEKRTVKVSMGKQTATWTVYVSEAALLKEKQKKAKEIAEAVAAAVAKATVERQMKQLDEEMNEYYKNLKYDPEDYSHFRCGGPCDGHCCICDPHYAEYAKYGYYDGADEI